jgi:hypothetical protein
LTKCNHGILPAVRYVIEERKEVHEDKERVSDTGLYHARVGEEEREQKEEE